jgi:uncharacterized protein YbjT (DUF2867 family)
MRGNCFNAQKLLTTVRTQSGEPDSNTTKSRIRYARVMGLKEETVQGVGFKSLAIFRPGIIAGNAHTPGYAAWLGRLIPGPWGTIEQDDIGRAFAAEFISSSAPPRWLRRQLR